ncbi:hypothetical protein V565_132560 [Rhizoctonia solani 123E]|uniref:Uncharacterized protein n=1 Tax=Rhizoctonia solani 123E TaxID=1423351 RepID=A0A074RMS5_9AGAM|nr:hypothetical protein V565_132560 [Rhizoctonia solani 123E]
MYPSGLTYSLDYKLVLVQDSEEHNPSPGPLNNPRPQPASGPAPYTFPVLYVDRPTGTPGKGPPKGFHVGDVLGLTRNEYGLLGVCRYLTNNPHPEFDIYKGDGYWPIEDMIYVKLKSFKEAYNRRSKSIQLGRQLMQTTDALTRDNALIKKRQLAKARGNAVQVGASNNDRDTPKPQESSADAMEAITHDISSMSIFVPDNGKSCVLLCAYTDQTVLLADTEEDFDGPFLPPSLSNPLPPSLESQAPILGLLPAPADSDPGFDTIHNEIAALRALSLADRAQLQPGIQLLLNVLDTNSTLPNPRLLMALLAAAPDDAINPTASHSTPSSAPASAPAQPNAMSRPRMRLPPPPSQALPKPIIARTPAPTATDLPVPNEPTLATALVPAPGPAPVPAPAPGHPVVTGIRRSSTVLTINELEPGPLTFQVDDSDDTLSDISVSMANPNQHDEGTEDERSQPAKQRGRGRGRGRGRANPEISLPRAAERNLQQWSI